jgi:hypothetical protein
MTTAQTYEYEYTDTFAGEAMDLTHYGYDGAQGYAKANAAQRRAIVRRVKASLGLTGHRAEVSDFGDALEIRPRGMATVCFVTRKE